MNDFGLKQEHIDAINHCLAQYPVIEQVILYGSRAKGNFRKGSDIDFVVIGDEVSRSDLVQLENELDDLLLPYKIDLTLKRQINNPRVLEQIEREGKLFYQKESIPILHDSRKKYRKV